MAVWGAAIVRLGPDDSVGRSLECCCSRLIAANYRPRSSLLLLSRLVGEKLAGTQYVTYFAGES